MAPGWPMPLPPAWNRNIDCGWVEFKSGRDDVRGYFARPKGGKNLTAIITVHENPGLIEHRQDVTRRIAEAGYASLTVDLYSRVGGRPPQDFKTPEERRSKAFLATPDEQSIPDLEAGCRYLEQSGLVDAGRIGAIGYCMGGGTMLAWIFGQTTRVKAAVAFYPTVVVPGPWRPDGKPLSRAAVAAQLTCPLQVHFGEADEAVKSADQRLLEDALKHARQPVEFYRYPATNHAFHDDTHPNYVGESARLAWQRAMQFLGRYLRDAGTGATAVAGE
jgi:carboxymethylenebutenolidase